MEYLKIETLKDDPALLLSLMFNRSYHHPEKYVAFDSSQLDHWWSIGSVLGVHSPKCVDMHGDDYGELVEWDKNAAHRRDILGFPRSLLILRAQRRVMAILKSAVEQLIDNCESLEQLEVSTQFNFKVPAAQGFFSGYEFKPYCAPRVLMSTRYFTGLECVSR